MKKLILLMTILCISSIVFSQKDTLKITKRAGIGAVKDILKKDELEVEITSLNNNIKIYEDNLRLKDSIISIKTNQLNIFKVKDTLSQKIIELNIEQKNNLNKSIQELNRQLKQEKRNVIISSISGIFLAFLVYEMVK